MGVGQFRNSYIGFAAGLRPSRSPGHRRTPECRIQLRAYRTSRFRMRGRNRHHRSFVQNRGSLWKEASARERGVRGDRHEMPSRSATHHACPNSRGIRFEVHHRPSPHRTTGKGRRARLGEARDMPPKSGAPMPQGDQGHFYATPSLFRGRGRRCRYRRDTRSLRGPRWLWGLPLRAVSSGSRSVEGSWGSGPSWGLVRLWWPWQQPARLIGRPGSLSPEL